MSRDRRWQYRSSHASSSPTNQYTYIQKQLRCLCTVCQPRTKVTTTTDAPTTDNKHLMLTIFTVVNGNADFHDWDIEPRNKSRNEHRLSGTSLNIRANPNGFWRRLDMDGQRLMQATRWREVCLQNVWLATFLGGNAKLWRLSMSLSAPDCRTVYRNRCYTE
jgi:hypothetical protein